MAGHQQSPSPDKGKAAPGKRPPLAQALRRAIESVEKADDVNSGPTGQSPMRRPDKKKTNVLQ